MTCRQRDLPDSLEILKKWRTTEESRNSEREDSEPEEEAGGEPSRVRQREEDEPGPPAPRTDSVGSPEPMREPSMLGSSATSPAGSAFTGVAENFYVEVGDPKSAPYTAKQAEA